MSSDRRLFATACKATSPEHAVVRVYETATWRPVGEPLAGHALTVTGIAFSPNDQFILTVSRDRTWRLFERKDTGELSSRFLHLVPRNSSSVIGFVPVAADRPHARIIWDCCWTQEGDKFITASRDKTVSNINLIQGIN